MLYGRLDSRAHAVYKLNFDHGINSLIIELTTSKLGTVFDYIVKIYHTKSNFPAQYITMSELVYRPIPTSP